MMNTYGRPDIVFNKGRGSWLFDEDGNQYLDLVAGVAVNALGHAYEPLAEVIYEQAKKLMHCSNLYYNDQQLKLAKTLTQLSGMEAAFFINSGTEAIETALKLSRKYGNMQNESKNKILYLKNSFHGRSLGSLTVTGQEKYQKPFMPLLGGTYCIEKVDIESLNNAFDDQVCAIILEPIQGEGGIIPLPEAFIEESHKLCDQYDALLIFDEVQCGIGRTGKMFAFENYTVQPDVVCLAKGLGGGFPIGAVLANHKANVFEKGDHGCTFGGNPLACAAANYVLGVVSNKEFLEDVKNKGEWARKEIENALKDYDDFLSVQGNGLILGVHFKSPVAAIIQKSFDNKILLVSAGANVIRLVPALNIEFDEWKSAIDTLIQIILE